MIEAYKFASAAELAEEIENEISRLNVCDPVWIAVDDHHETGIYVIVLSPCERNQNVRSQKVVFQSLNIITEGEWVIGTPKDVAALAMSLLSQYTQRAVEARGSGRKEQYEVLHKQCFQP
jgi:hypothetical protein